VLDVVSVAELVNDVAVVVEDKETVLWLVLVSEPVLTLLCVTVLL